MKVFWIIYEICLFIGAVAWGLLILKYGNLYKSGKKKFGERVQKLSEKMDREEAMHFVQCKKRTALINCISSSAIEFVFVYAIVDILFTHIIGG